MGEGIRFLTLVWQVSSLVLVITFLCFQEGRISAAVFSTHVWFNSPWQTPFYVKVLYSYPYEVRPGTLFDVPVLLVYPNETHYPATLKSIYVTNVIIRVRDSLKGPNLYSSSPDSSKIPLTPMQTGGDQYSHTFRVPAPSTSGHFLVVINFDVKAAGIGYHYDSKQDKNPYRDWERMNVQNNMTVATLTVNINNLTGLAKSTIFIPVKHLIIDNKIISVYSNRALEAKGIYHLDSSHTVHVPIKISLGNGYRAIFSKWSDGNSANPRQVTLTNDVNLLAIYRPQYLLAIHSDYGDPEGSKWYNDGDLANFSIKSPLFRTFDHWDGNIPSALATSTQGVLLMDEPKAITAHWRIDFTLVSGILGVVIGAVVGGFGYFVGFTKHRKIKTMYKSIIDGVYNSSTNNKDECLDRFRELKMEIMELRDKGEISANDYERLSEKISRYKQMVAKS
jgi:hypothetical protein